MVQDVKQKAANDDSAFDQEDADRLRKNAMLDKIRATRAMLNEKRKTA